jgi:hypothetical protein
MAHPGGEAHHCFILWHKGTSYGVFCTVLLTLVITNAAVLPVEVRSNAGAPDSRVSFVHLNNTASSCAVSVKIQRTEVNSGRRT